MTVYSKAKKVISQALHAFLCSLAFLVLVGGVSSAQAQGAPSVVSIGEIADAGTGGLTLPGGIVVTATPITTGTGVLGAAFGNAGPGLGGQYNGTSLDPSRPAGLPTLGTRLMATGNTIDNGDTNQYADAVGYQITFSPAIPVDYFYALDIDNPEWKTAIAFNGSTSVPVGIELASDSRNVAGDVVRITPTINAASWTAGTSLPAGATIASTQTIVTSVAATDGNTDPDDIGTQALFTFGNPGDVVSDIVFLFGVTSNVGGTTGGRNSGLSGITLNFPILESEKGAELSAVNPADGSYDVTYTIEIGNSGSGVIDAIDLEDILDAASNLGAAFDSIVTAPVVNPVESSNGSTFPSGNTAYDGTATNPSLLTLGDTIALEGGDSFEVVFTARINPNNQGAVAPFSNSIGVTAGSTTLFPGIDFSENSDNDDTSDSTPGVDVDTADGIDGDDNTSVVDLPVNVGGIALLKAAVLDTEVVGGAGDTAVNVGDQITYTYTVTNTSTLLNVVDVTVGEPNVAPNLFSGTGTLPSPANEVGGAGNTLSTDAAQNASWDVLAPGETVTFTATYTLTQADIDAGVVDNSAVASAQDPFGNALSDVSDGTDVAGSEPTSVALGQTPGIELVKSVSSVDDTNSNGIFGDAGDTVNFTFTALNTGNTALAGVSVDDTGLTLLTGASVLTPDTGFDGTLAVGEGPLVVAAATYVIDASDVAAGGITNTAEATSIAVATDASGDPDPSAPLTDAMGVALPAVMDGSDSGSDPALDDTDGTVSSVGDPAGSGGSDDPTVLTLPAPGPGIELVKSVSSVDDTNSNGIFGDAGDTVNFTFTALNTGNTALAGVSVDDTGLTLLTGASVLTPDTGFDGTLAVGEGPLVVAAATYVIDASDVAAGEITNTAEATSIAVATDASGDPDPSAPLTDAMGVALPAVMDGSDSGSDPALDDTDGTVPSVGDPAGTGGSDDPTVLTLPAPAPGNAANDVLSGLDTGTAGVIDPLGNDDDPDGTLDPTTVALTDPAATDADGDGFPDTLVVAGEGTWTVDPATGAVTFTPEAGFTANPTPVGYTVDDNDGNTSNEATITLEYEPELPVATNDVISNLDTGTAGVVDPFADNGNGVDADPDGTLDPTTVALTDPAATDADGDGFPDTLVVAGEGTWTVDPATGAVTFTPEAGFTANPTPVGYTVDDNDGNTSNEATITLEYEPELPVAANDVLSGLDTGTAGVIDPLGNDADPDGTLDPTTVALTDPAATDADGDGFPDTLVVAGEGTWTVDPATGAVTFTPEAGFTANPTPVGYTVDDNDGNTSNEATITLEYEPDVDLVAEIEEDLESILEEDLANTLIIQSNTISGYSANALDRLLNRSSDGNGAPNTCLASVNAQLATENIQFDTDQAIIKEASYPIIDRIATTLQGCGGSAFEIAGHTDSDASDAYNLDLSQRRAEAVVFALSARDVDTTGFRARGFGEREPIASNATADGKRQNRRVEFREIDIRNDIQPEQCEDGFSLVRNFNANAGENGLNADGDFVRDSYSCVTNIREVYEGSINFIDTDTGQDQTSFNLSYRREQYRGSESVFGYFGGLYGSRTDVDRLADGEVNGYGVNAGVYGANRLQQELFVDYYLGAAVGRHDFDLDFDRDVGEISTSGDYTYVAGFVGAALSGNVDVGEAKLTPRVGFDYVYTPGNNVDVDADLGNFSQSGSVDIDSISGGRVFAEVRSEHMFNDEATMFYINPRASCYQSLGELDGVCGFGGSIGIVSAEADNGLTYAFEVDSEFGEDYRFGSLSMSIARDIGLGKVSGKADMGSEGNMTFGGLLEMAF